MQLKDERRVIFTPFMASFKEPPVDCPLACHNELLMDFCSVRSIHPEFLQQLILWCHLNVMVTTVHL